jgi:hypothetical protein
VNHRASERVDGVGRTNNFDAKERRAEKDRQITCSHMLDRVIISGRSRSDGIVRAKTRSTNLFREEVNVAISLDFGLDR